MSVRATASRVLHACVRTSAPRVLIRRAPHLCWTPTLMLENNVSVEHGVALVMQFARMLPLVSTVSRAGVPSVSRYRHKTDTRYRLAVISLVLVSHMQRLPVTHAKACVARMRMQATSSAIPTLICWLFPWCSMLADSDCPRLSAFAKPAVSSGDPVASRLVFAARLCWSMQCYDPVSIPAFPSSFPNLVPHALFFALSDSGSCLPHSDNSFQ